MIQATIKSSSLWQHFQVLPLTRNMRVHESEIEFTEFLLQVENAQSNILSSDVFFIPEALRLKEKEDIVGTWEVPFLYFSLTDTWDLTSTLLIF
ncbi:hypothetical protein HMI56_004103, partial [Coelomomyces lativittatus]